MQSVRTVSGDGKKFAIKLPREYEDNIIFRQMQNLIDEEIFWDVEVEFRSSGDSIKMSAFFLSLLSPVFHRMLCGSFEERFKRRIAVQDMEPKVFRKLVELGCGFPDMEVGTIDELVELAYWADRFQMNFVASIIEEAALEHLSVDACANMLIAGSHFGLSELESRSFHLLLDSFEKASKSQGFCRLDDDTMCRILQHEDLIAESENVVLEGLLRWAGACDSGIDVIIQKQQLLSLIRWPLINSSALADPAAHQEIVETLLQVHLANVNTMKFRAYASTPPGPLASPRKQRLFPWERYAGGGEDRMTAHSLAVFALAECGGCLCSGSQDGTVRVWRIPSLDLIRILRPRGDDVASALAPPAVSSLLAWDGRLVAGYADGTMRTWNVCTGLCEGEARGHEDRVRAMVVCEGRLLTGSWDKTVRVWSRDGTSGAGLVCQDVLKGHRHDVVALAVWGGLALSGSTDASIRVWAPQSVGNGWEALTTLEGHTDTVSALVVVRDAALISASLDQTLRVWALGSWVCLQQVRAFGPEAGRTFVHCLAVTGGGTQLVAGSASDGDDPARGELAVWAITPGAAGGPPLLGADGPSLRIAQPGGAMLEVLLAGADGRVWAGVGSEVALWTRD